MAKPNQNNAQMNKLLAYSEWKPYFAWLPMNIGGKRYWFKKLWMRSNAYFTQYSLTPGVQLSLVVDNTKLQNKVN